MERSIAATIKGSEQSLPYQAIELYEVEQPEVTFYRLAIYELVGCGVWERTVTIDFPERTEAEKFFASVAQ